MYLKINEDDFELLTALTEFVEDDEEEESP